MDNSALIFWGLIFSSIGFGYFLYGKKQSNLIALLCGIVLMIYPYFISNSTILVVMGIVIMAVPYFL